MTDDQVNAVWMAFTEATKEHSQASIRASAALGKVTAEMGLCPSPADTPAQRLAWERLIVEQAAQAISGQGLAMATGDMVRMIAGQRDAADALLQSTAFSTTH